MINKIAGPRNPTAPVPAPSAPARTSTTTPAPGSQQVRRQSVGYGGFIPEVKLMQGSMQRLAARVLSDANLESYLKDTSPSEAADEVTKKSRKAFSDFFTQHYLATTDPKYLGEEWDDKRPMNLTEEEIRARATGLYEFNIIMENFKRIGMRRSEFKADGVWDFRTLNSLKNIHAFGLGMLKLVNDFKLSVNNRLFTESDAQNFRNSLPATDEELRALSSQEKKSRAAKINSYIGKITSLYSFFRDQLLAIPQYSQYIDGKKNFLKINNVDNFASEEDKKLSKLITVGVSTKLTKKDGKPIEYYHPSVLADANRFKEWVTKDLGYTTEEVPEILRKILTELEVIK